MYEKLSNEQLIILKKLSSVDYEIISKNAPPIYRFLATQGYIFNGYDNSLPNRPYTARITQDGKAYLATHSWKQKQFLLPMTISAIALAVSIASFIFSIVE